MQTTFAILVTVFLTPFCFLAVRGFAKEFGCDDFPKWLILAWCGYAIMGAAMILFLVRGVALDPKLQ